MAWIDGRSTKQGTAHFKTVYLPSILVASASHGLGGFDYDSVRGLCLAPTLPNQPINCISQLWPLFRVYADCAAVFAYLITSDQHELAARFVVNGYGKSALAENRLALWRDG
jgi:hypothetical protein